jgi:hypothetical protein
VELNYGDPFPKFFAIGHFPGNISREAAACYAAGAAYHAGLGRKYEHEFFAIGHFPGNISREAAACYAAGAVYHADLGRKYEHAARYPWLSVEPDPPKPRDPPMLEWND